MNFHLIFPAAFFLNTFALQLVVVAAGLSGRHLIAADISLAQAAMIAVFFSFSGNARNLLLKDSSSELVDSITRFRLLSLPILVLVSIFLCLAVSEIRLYFVVVIVTRQISEWFAELDLAGREKRRDYRFAKEFTGVSIVTLVSALGALLFFESFFLHLLLIWAAAPLFLCREFVLGAIRKLGSRTRFDWGKILPNFSSTFVIGLGVFFFRLLVSGFAGKAVAGQLFTAFAIGGVLSSVYERTLGPSMKVSPELFALGSRVFNWARFIPAAGALVILAVLYLFPDSTYVSGNLYLLVSLGFSLVGGYVMIHAQKAKIDLLHSEDRDDVFVADLLSNFAILGMIPAVFLLSGETSFVLLYLLNSLVVLVSYRIVGSRVLKNSGNSGGAAAQFFIASAILLPVFIQLGSGIFFSGDEHYDWGGSLAMLPLPLSAFVCFPAILLLNSVRKSILSSGFVFLVFCTMLGGAVISSAGNYALAKPKIVLAIQYLLPYFGFVLASHLSGAKSFYRRFTLVCLLVAAGIVFLQLTYSVQYKAVPLNPNAYFFSIYHNLQYVNLVIVSAFILALFSLYDRWKGVFLSLIPALFLYSALSWSLSSMLLAVSGVLLFCVLRKFEIKLVLSFAVGLLLFYAVGKAISTWDRSEMGKMAFLSGEAVGGNKIENYMPNVAERRRMWSYYLSGMASADSKTVIFGHQEIPPKQLYPSAHNYYLDMLYNFGLVAVTPLAGLLLYTMFFAWKSRGVLGRDTELVGLAFVVAYILLVDNSLKVGLRQPYSGIYTFFVWGLLLARLKNAPRQVTEPRLRAQE
jgi:hypothetical protein